MTEENDKSKINSLNDMLSEHFDKTRLNVGDINSYLKLSQDEAGLGIKNHETVSHFKFGIFTEHGGEKSYYALPCELDEDYFRDPLSMEAIKRDLNDGTIEAHDLSMDYFNTGFLRKYSFEENGWTIAQAEHSIMSKRDFIFVKEKDFLESFLNEFDARKLENTNPTAPAEPECP